MYVMLVIATDFTVWLAYPQVPGVEESGTKRVGEDGGQVPTGRRVLVRFIFFSL